jgi:1,4-dihydroxy-2-naphthoyl-CoA hydrolase
MTAETSGFRSELTPEMLNSRGAGHLPGLIGLRVVSLSSEGLESRLEVRKELMAPNGFLHAATVIAIADTSCGYACVANLPQGASGFTTLELKANFLGTTREGAIFCRATPVHLGRTTQVWDAVVTIEGTDRRIALFRCTQMVLWPARVAS